MPIEVKNNSCPKIEAMWTFDVDGGLIEMGSLGPLEELGMAVAPWIARDIKRFIQNPNLPFRQRREKIAAGFFSKKPARIDGLNGLIFAAEQLPNLRDEGIKLTLGILSDRPQWSVGLTREIISMGLFEINPDLDLDELVPLPNCEFNPLGGDPIKVKAIAARRFKKEGIIHGHLDNDPEAALMTAEEGSDSYLLRTSATRRMKHEPYHCNLTLVDSTKEAEELYFEKLHELATV